MKSLLRLTVSAALLAATVVGAGTPSTARPGQAMNRARLAARDDLPTFGRPTLGGIDRGGGGPTEPGLWVDPLGRMYESTPAKAPYSEVWRSLDDGKTFKWLPGAAPQTGRLPTCPKAAGGDIEIAPDSAGNLYVIDHEPSIATPAYDAAVSRSPSRARRCAITPPIGSSMPSTGTPRPAGMST